MGNVTKFLVENKIKPSYQRMSILEYLIKYKTHPTVDEIHQKLVVEIPTLSKTTVYNTLKLFVEKGIVLLINIEDNETRYDADTSAHGHFKCVKCNKIYDFSFNNADIVVDELKQYIIQQTHLYIKGICLICL